MITVIEITPAYLASQGLSPTFPERFWAKVRKTETCWIWTAGRVSGGRYGGIAALYVKGTYRTITIRAHVASWILHFGPVPEGLEVCHTCDNPLCVQPAHLWVGTHAQNMADCKAKGRGRGVPGEAHGMAKLTKEQVGQIRCRYSSAEKNGERLAREFNVTRQQIWHIIHGHQRSEG